ncbi:uncharacterized protein LOC128318740 [Pangasianodon hypophthalmus]|uniref:uncharacterized protein LOC128318740 n=1 Tax=Pangasianodon hypophthalmus TaxID=310915 RepID=UPI00230746E1|nr:uncharacterized protein LOC128318740 [Pangasianodon hypophthalmus]
MTSSSCSSARPGHSRKSLAHVRTVCDAPSSTSPHNPEVPGLAVASCRDTSTRPPYWKGLYSIASFTPYLRLSSSSSSFIDVKYIKSYCDEFPLGVRQKIVMKLSIFLSLLLVECVLSAHSGVFSQRSTEGRDIILFCKNEGSVSWDRRADGGRIHVFFVQDEKDTIVCHRGPDRFTVLADSSLLIKKASVSDSGIYYCNDSPVVNLTVTPSQESSTSTYTTASFRKPTGGVSGVERGLMFGGVGLAGLVFLLATVAAGRAIAHRAWQAGRDSVLLSSD